jgi:hypothetical protein
VLPARSTAAQAFAFFEHLNDSSPDCATVTLADIGHAIGFNVPKIGVRYLDRDRRMMPAASKVDSKSQIQQRMHEEYVIGFYKPIT